jgi:DHA2 family multidrug resistance protein-like MFS transporter
MADTDGLPAPQRYLSISVVWIGLVMSVLDGSIANLALPTLAHQLDATASQSIWVINAYALGMVMLLLPLAACGEILGYGRIYLAGMAAFTLASGICIFAPTMTVLCLGRALQGAGAAGMMSMTPPCCAPCTRPACWAGAWGPTPSASGCRPRRRRRWPRPSCRWPAGAGCSR